jgi:anti-anti-sigma factor
VVAPGVRLVRAVWARIGVLIVADAGHLGIRAERAGRVCVLSVSGELDFLCAESLVRRARGLVDGRAERLVLDLSGLMFADCAGVRALAAVTGLVPGHCPVIVRSASPGVRRILELTGADLESRRGAAVPGPGGRRDGPYSRRVAGRGRVMVPPPGM